MSEIKTHLGEQVDKSLADLLSSTEALGHAKGSFETAQRIITILEETAKLLTDEGLTHNAAGINVAIKMIGGVFVAKPHN